MDDLNNAHFAIRGNRVHISAEIDLEGLEPFGKQLMLLREIISHMAVSKEKPDEPPASGIEAPPRGEDA